MPLSPEALKEWFPIIRDYTFLLVGMGAGIYGVVSRQAGLASVGFGMAGVGAVGRVHAGDP